MQRQTGTEHVFPPKISYCGYLSFRDHLLCSSKVCIPFSGCDYI